MYCSRLISYPLTYSQSFIGFITFIGFYCLFLFAIFIRYFFLPRGNPGYQFLRLSYKFFLYIILLYRTTLTQSLDGDSCTWLCRGHIMKFSSVEFSLFIPFKQLNDRIRGQIRTWMGKDQKASECTANSPETRPRKYSTDNVRMNYRVAQNKILQQTICNFSATSYPILKILEAA